MFRQTGNGPAGASLSGQLLVTEDGGGGGGDVNLIEVGGVAITLGQKSMAASVPVVLASDQTPVPVTVADGADFTQGAIADSAVDTDTTGTVSGKLRGLIKLWVNYLSRFPATLGQGTMAQSLRVVLPSDQSSVPVTAAQATASNFNAQVMGSITHDDPDSGNPVKVGSIAKTALPTAVAANDRVNQIADIYGRPFVRHGLQGPSSNYWDAQHVPSANAQATITKATAGAGVRNVCTGFTVSLAATASAPAAVQITVAVIDGATGGTTYLWRSVISLPAVAGAITSFVRSGIWLPGTADTGLTIEFSAAGGANTIESVTMEGTVVAE